MLLDSHLAFEKTLSHKGQDYLVQVVDTAGQVSELLIYVRLVKGDKIILSYPFGWLVFLL